MNGTLSDNGRTLSIILPAKNEAHGLRALIPQLREHLPEAEVIVVNDGSTDATAEVARDCGARVHSHPYSMGNGAAVKSGARIARGQILVFMDADGQHNPADIPRLLAKLDEGYDMAVGARSSGTQASTHRAVANSVYNKLASWMVNQKIDDLSSGFRAARAHKFREFLHMLPNGFSYPTTITMAFFRAGYPVAYVPINARQRIGTSHIRLVRDGVRFLIIIFRVGTLYSPLKVFLPFSLLFFLTGIGYYIYTYATEGRFTNMSALLFTTSVVVGLIGLVSEQITNLLYAQKTKG